MYADNTMIMIANEIIIDILILLNPESGLKLIQNREKSIRLVSKPWIYHIIINRANSIGETKIGGIRIVGCLHLSLKKNILKG